MDCKIVTYEYIAHKLLTTDDEHPKVKGVLSNMFDKISILHIFVKYVTEHYCINCLLIN